MKKPNSNLKKILIFAALVFVCFLLGFCVGHLASTLDVLKQLPDRLSTAWHDLCRMIAPGLPALFYAIALIGAGASLLFIAKSKRILSVWDGECEETVERAHDLLGCCITIGNLMLIIDYFCLALWARVNAIAPSGHISVIITLIGFITTLLLCIVIQYITVEMTKKLNPEKKGNLLDLRFQKEWFNSCDERERAVIGQAAYAAFRATNSLCLVLWVICMFGELFFGMGLFPAAAITLIWLCSSLTYTVKSAKLEKHK